MSDDQFMKIMRELKCIDDGFDAKLEAMDKKFDDKFDKVYRILDHHTELLDRDESEWLVLSKQVDRHNDWIERAAVTTGVRFARTD